MRASNLYITIFGLLIIAQISVPLLQILNKQNTLENGNLLKFKCSADIPRTNSKGYYLNLNFLDNILTNTENEYSYNQSVYAIFSLDSAGYAQLLDAEINKPSGDVIYTKARTDYDNFKFDNHSDTKLIYPFNRYYISEKKAKAIEKIINSDTRDIINLEIYVRILDGDYTVESIKYRNETILDLWD